MAEFLVWVKEQYGLDVKAHRNIKVSHNSNLVKEFDLPLKDGDQVSLIPIVAGG